MDLKNTPYGKNLFVFIVIAFCLGVATIMGFDKTLETKVAEIVADGLISLALFVAVSYLASYSVDYSGILSKVGQRVSARGLQEAQSPYGYTSLDPAYAPDYYAPEVGRPTDNYNDQARG